MWRWSATKLFGNSSLALLRMIEALSVMFKLEETTQLLCCRTCLASGCVEEDCFLLLQAVWSENHGNVL